MNTPAASARAPTAKTVVRRRAVARVAVMGSGSVDWRAIIPEAARRCQLKIERAAGRIVKARAFGEPRSNGLQTVVGRG